MSTSALWQLFSRDADDDGLSGESPDALGPDNGPILHRDLVYPKNVWWLIITAIGVATLVNLGGIIWARCRVYQFEQSRKHRNRNSMQFGSGTMARTQRPMGTTPSSVRRIPAAILTAFRIIWLRCTLPLPPFLKSTWGNGMTPNLTEGLATFCYLIILLTWEFVNTNDLDYNFWVDRAGHLAASQIPLLPALSSKNNIIGWLTGLGHEKLNLFHRGVARCILVLIWIHFWGRYATTGFVAQDDISQNQWQQFGAAAGLIFTVVVVLSIRPIRAWAYELFYFAHVVLVFTFLICVFLHTKGRGFQYYIWPAWIVWGFDRLCRVLRHVALDLLWRPPRSTGPNTAMIELLTDDSLRLIVRRRMRVPWRAGQHCFLTIPSVSRVPLEAHPFSIASLPAQKEDASVEDDELVFIVRARGGMTERLQKLAGQEVKSVPVYLDGPYGNPPDLAPYVTSILVAGGSGISYILPQFLQLVRQVEARKACTRRIVFIWTIRDEAHLTWIMEHLTGALSSVPEFLGLDALEVGVYVTGRKTAGSSLGSSESWKNKFEMQRISRFGRGTLWGKSGGDTSGLSEEIDRKQSFELPGGLTVHRGRRPNIREILQEELGVAEGPISVNVSGPGSLVEAVRSTLASPLTGPLGVLRGMPTVFFHAENYTL